MFHVEQVFIEHVWLIFKKKILVCFINLFFIFQSYFLSASGLRLFTFISLHFLVRNLEGKTISYSYWCSENWMSFDKMVNNFREQLLVYDITEKRNKQYETISFNCFVQKTISFTWSRDSTEIFNLFNIKELSRKTPLLESILFLLTPTEYISLEIALTK